MLPGYSFVATSDNNCSTSAVDSSMDHYYR
jgi:hypothetical protein